MIFCVSYKEAPVGIDCLRGCISPASVPQTEERGRAVSKLRFLTARRSKICPPKQRIFRASFCCVSVPSGLFTPRCRSALEEKHRKLAGVVQIQTLVRLSRHFEREAFTHDAVERVAVLAVHLFLHNFARLLPPQSESVRQSSFIFGFDWRSCFLYLPECRHPWRSRPSQFRS